jgi:hypothetical protein
MALFEYQKQIQRFLREQRQRQINPEDLTSYVNRARREIAMRTQSIRVTPPTSGAIVAIHVTNPGSGYTNPTVVVSTPDYPNQSLPYPNGAQATALAIPIAGQIASVSVSFGGDGYQQPTATITDPTGSGAVLSVEVEPIWTTRAFQERYRLADIPLDHFPGVKAAYAVREIAMIYSNYRYGLPCYPWSTYQFFIRQYPRQYYYVPTICTRFRPGALGDWFFYPIPNTSYPWDWDLACLPSDLEDDQSVEALSEPWTDAVPFLGAAFAMEELQNLNSARYYRALHDQYIKQYSQAAYLTTSVNPYGGW